MKQSAVEFIFEELENRENGSYSFTMEQIYNKAKEMEKQQIIDAVDKTNSKWKSQKAEIILMGNQYYNETFNK
jgi:hypothetical protein